MQGLNLFSLGLFDSLYFALRSVPPGLVGSMGFDYLINYFILSGTGRNAVNNLSILGTPIQVEPPSLLPHPGCNHRHLGKGMASAAE